MSGRLRLQLIVGDCHFETVDIERASVIAVRDVPPEHPLWNAAHRSGFACFVTTKNGDYVVSGMPAEVADKVWPAPAVCPECKRPR